MKAGVTKGASRQVRQCGQPDRTLFDEIHYVVTQPQINRHFRVQLSKPSKRWSDHMQANGLGSGNSQAARRHSACRFCHLLDLFCIAQQAKRALMQVAPLGG